MEGGDVRRRWGGVVENDRGEEWGRRSGRGGGEGGMWCLMGRGCGPPTGRPASLVPGRAARRAGLAAHTRHALPGRASPGTMQARPGPGLGRAKKPGFRTGCRAAGCVDNYTRGPVSCLASPLEPGTIAQAGPPEAHSSKYISPYSKFNKQFKKRSQITASRTQRHI